MVKSGTNLGLVDLSSDAPQWRHLVTKTNTTSGQLDIWKAFGSSWPSVLCTSQYKDLVAKNGTKVGPVGLSLYIPPTFWTFHIAVFVNTIAMVVNSYTVLYMCMEVIICQSDRSPERLMISHTLHRGNLKSAQVGEGMWRKLFQLLGCVLQNSSFSKQDIPNLSKLWHFGPSTFLYLSIIQLW